MRLRGPCIGGILSPLPIVQGMGGHGQIVNTVQIVRGVSNAVLFGSYAYETLNLGQIIKREITKSYLPWIISMR